MTRMLVGYLDPGTGSVILQALLGGVAALAVTGKLWWARVTSIFRRDRGDTQPEAEGPAPGPNEG